MENRETTEFELAGKKFVIKNWLTAGEEQEINAVMMEKVSFNPNMRASDVREGKMDMQFSEISASVTVDQGNKKIELAVVSIDGATDKILEKCLAMRSSHFKELQTKINEMIDQGLE